MSAPVRSDAELLAAHVAGDRTAFAELVGRHSHRLWALAARIMRSREEASDALQEALMSAHQAAPRFRAEAAVSTWLHRIVVNACIDRIRHNQVRPTVPLFAGGRAEPRAGGDQIETLPTRLAVQDALALLPDEQRLAVVLVDLEGYPVAEVAALVKVAEGTVKSRCARGRAKLAVLLGHLRDTDPEPDTTQPDTTRPDPLVAGKSLDRSPETGAIPTTGRRTSRVAPTSGVET